MSHFPIIHIIGLPGAGKTTLGDKLAKKFDVPVMRIGNYRSRFPITETGEADAWVTLFSQLSSLKWGHCILETTGLNKRESFIRTALPFSRMVRVKLVAQRKVLYDRLRKKKAHEQGGDWLYRESYRDKYEFVRKLFKSFKEIPADFNIDTSKRTPEEVYDIVLEKLRVCIPQEL